MIRNKSVGLVLVGKSETRNILYETILKQLDRRIPEQDHFQAAA